jgi:hypothetical protein
MFVVYSAMVRLAGWSPRAFFRQVQEVMLMAFSTASSNATLPTSLRVAEQNLKLPNKVSRFVLTVGATANQNGTALFEGVTVLFLAQFFGVDLSLGQQFTVMFVCILGGIGTAGVPAGSLPVVALICAMVGVPPEGIGIILGVDRFLDMCRTTLNVTGDLMLATVVAKGEADERARPLAAPAEGRNRDSAGQGGTMGGPQPGGRFRRIPTPRHDAAHRTPAGQRHPFPRRRCGAGRQLRPPRHADGHGRHRRSAVAPFYRHNPLNPHWADRDRFVLSNGHGSMLQYALLHLSGYDLPIEELKLFRQLGSKTAGHPERHETPGVETTTGPLGQGVANAVGFALAEKLLAQRFNRPGFEVVDHRTWVFLGDGCLMEACRTKPPRWPAPGGCTSWSAGTTTTSPSTATSRAGSPTTRRSVSRPTAGT